MFILLPGSNKIYGKIEMKVENNGTAFRKHY